MVHGRDSTVSKYVSDNDPAVTPAANMEAEPLTLNLINICTQ